MRECEDCGTRLLNDGRCPNCEEESVILDQYLEQGMKLPPDDSEFMKKAMEQNSKRANRNESKHWNCI